MEENIIQEVYRQINELAFSEERAITDEDRHALATTNFSEDDILVRLDKAVSHVGSIVKSDYLDGCIETRNPATESWNWGNVVRVLGDRVTVSGKHAPRRTFREDRALQASRRKSDDENPVYIYDDVEIVTRGDGTCKSCDVCKGIPDVLVDYITDPKLEDLYDTFMSALVMHVVSDCFATLKRLDLAVDAKKRFYSLISPYALPRVNLNEGA
jgi:hypothetical protein